MQMSLLEEVPGAMINCSHSMGTEQFITKAQRCSGGQVSVQRQCEGARGCCALWFSHLIICTVFPPVEIFFLFFFLLYLHFQRQSPVPSLPRTFGWLAQSEKIFLFIYFSLILLFLLVWTQFNLWPFSRPKNTIPYALYFCVCCLLSPTKGRDRFVPICNPIKYRHFDVLVFTNYSLPSFRRATKLVWKWGYQSQQFIIIVSSIKSLNDLDL